MSTAMSQEEYDSRVDAGEDPIGVVADDYRRRGWEFRDGAWRPPQCDATTPVSHAEEQDGIARCVNERGHPGHHVYAFALASEADR